MGEFPAPNPKPFEVRLFTDGACIRNPGPGGWAFILKHPATGRTKERSGGERQTTNNRMEITGVIRGLEALNRPSIVDLFSDSQYVVNAISKWMGRWKRFGWKKSSREPGLVKNVDLWQRLDELMQRHTLRAHWVRGHNGHAENERCDLLADKAASKAASIPAPPRPDRPDRPDRKLRCNDLSNRSVPLDCDYDLQVLPSPPDRPGRDRGTP